MEGRIWTVSNGLSFLRVLLAYPIVVLILSDQPSGRMFAALLILAAACTDFLDGLLARRMGQISDVGKVIDPLADKIGIGAVAVALAVKGSLPLWFLGGVLMRDLLIFAGGLYIQRARGLILQSTMVGKWAAGVLAFLILAVVVDLPEVRTAVTILQYACAGLLAASFGIYTRRFYSLITNPQSP
jgi:CDP-diacylglycerol--glycerol-3-phosphate 3-phosphatidyltransferase